MRERTASYCCWNVSFADITIIKKKNYLEKYNCGNWLFQVAEGYSDGISDANGIL